MSRRQTWSNHDSSWRLTIDNKIFRPTARTFICCDDVGLVISNVFMVGYAKHLHVARFQGLGIVFVRNACVSVSDNANVVVRLRRRRHRHRGNKVSCFAFIRKFEPAISKFTKNFGTF